MAGGKNVAIAIIGGTGSGKSTQTRDLINIMKPSNLEIYDVNNEYSDIIDQPFEEMKEFQTRVKECTNTLIVFEEASMFFSNRGGAGDEMRSILVRKRHQRNDIILNFHSVRQLPRDIADFVDYVYLKKTNDTEKFVREKIDDDEFIEMWREVKTSKDPYVTRCFKMR